jgi:3-methyladenine DNA glycosylase AlkD
MEPAVIGMKYEVGIDHKLGINKYMITGGTASWEGQSLETCQKQMDEWAKEFNSWDVCDQCCSNLFDKMPFAG